MKTTLTLTASLLISLSIFGAISAQASEVSQSELKLRGCIAQVYGQAASSKMAAKDITKAVSAGIKDCRQSVKAIAKAERAAKKRSKLETQLKKLQAKLSGLN